MRWLKRRRRPVDLTLPRTPRPMGGLLTYVGVFLFTTMLYLRPNDILPIGDFPIVKISGALAVIALLVEQLAVPGFTIVPPELKYMLVLLGLMVLSIPLALNPQFAFDALSDSYLKAVLLVIGMINSVLTMRRLRGLMWLTAACGTFVALGSLRDWLASTPGQRAEGFIGGIFANSNDLALALNIFWPLALGLLLTSRSVMMKLLYLGGIVSMVAAVVVTSSRAGFLSLAAIGVYMAIVPGRRAKWIRLAVPVAIVAVILLAPAGYFVRILSIFDHSLDATGSAGVRTDVLARSLDVAGTNPIRWIFGVGVYNFNLVSIHDMANHNAYLQVFNEVGLPAAIIYVIFLYTVLKLNGRLVAITAEHRSLRQEYQIGIALQASIIAYCVGSFFGSVAYLWYVYWPVAYVVALRNLTLPRLPASAAVPAARPQKVPA